MSEPQEEIVCVQIAYPNGERVFEPLLDYLRNPPRETFILRESGRPRVEALR